MTEQENTREQDSTIPPAPVTIEPKAQETGSAEGGTSEDALQGYKDLIEQQKEEISALLDNQKSLQAQIGNLINNTGISIGNDTGGVHGGDDGSNASHNDDYVSLADLGKDLGVRDYRSHNMQEGAPK